MIDKFIVALPVKCFRYEPPLPEPSARLIMADAFVAWATDNLTGAYQPVEEPNHRQFFINFVLYDEDSWNVELSSDRDAILVKLRWT